MSKYSESLAILLGREPRKPEKFSESAQKIHELKRVEKVDWVAQKEHARAHRAQGQPWRNRRWAFLIAINLLFVVSFWLDIQILEGALTASRLLGFHMIDVNSALQVMLAHKHIINNLIIGTGTVVVLWLLFGGRTFCSWVCPYHLVAEWAEKLHVYLAEKKIVTDHTFHRGVRTVLWIVFAAMAWITGYTVFETISPDRHPVACADLRAGAGAGLGGAVAGFRDILFAPRLVSLCLSDRLDLRLRRRVFAAARQVRSQSLLSRGRLPQGVRSAACAGNRQERACLCGDPGYRRRLHALRGVCGCMSERGVEIRRERFDQAAVNFYATWRGG